MKKEDNITPKKYICNVSGDIYNVEFKKVKDFDVGKYISFIEDLKHANLDLFLKTITNISTDDLVNYFNNLDVNALNLLWWLLAGGILYTIGGVIYGLKWPHLKNKYFGFHEIFHIFILLGSACHFIFILSLLSI